MIFTRPNRRGQEERLQDYQDRIVALGPAAYWPMTETSGTTATDIIAGKNGTYGTRSARSAQNVIESGRSCEGLGGTYTSNAGIPMLVNDDPLFDIAGGSFTLECWIKGGETAMFAKYLEGSVWPTYICYVGNATLGARIALRSSNSGTITKQMDANIAVVAGRTYHYCFVKNAGVDCFWSINGRIVTFANDTTTIWNSTAPLGFGGVPCIINTQTALSGYMGHAALYNKALTRDQVQANFNAGASF